MSLISETGASLLCHKNHSNSNSNKQLAYIANCGISLYLVNMKKENYTGSENNNNAIVQAQKTIAIIL